MKNIITFLGVLMLLGCSSTNISQYQNTTPKINVKEFFNGKIEGHGFFQNRFTGKIEKRYYVEMTGSWNGNDGTLSEVFYLDDNTTMKRQWHLNQPTKTISLALQVTLLARQKAKHKASRYN